MGTNDSKSPRIIINKLTLVGVRKNYSILFNPGVNIIHGDSDTGKSSILNLIDYCFGSSHVDLYTEIENNGRYCLLEVDLNEKVYTIKRDIFNSNEFIEVYHSGIEEMNTVFPLSYGPNYSRKGDAGYISDFFLDALSIPKIETKQSPSKADSKMNKLSFRDILKYNYINQDDVGSKDLLDRSNFSVAVKNQETFKFLHHLLDTNITEHQALIAEKTAAKKALEEKFSTISAFFRETQLRTEDALLTERSEVNDKLGAVNNELNSLNKEMRASSENDNELRNLIADFESEMRTKRRHIDDLKIQISQNVLLKNEYYHDIQKLQSTIEIATKLPEHSETLDCPVCSTPIVYDKIAANSENTSIEVLRNEVKSLNLRSKDLSQLIDENRNELFHVENSLATDLIEVEQARNLLDNQTKELISPFLSQRDGLLTTRAKLLESIGHIDYTLKIRNQLGELSKSSAKIAIELERLLGKLEELQASTPTVELVTNSISENLQDFLHFVKMNNVYGVGIDSRTFLPKVRDREYYHLTSGGVRTLVSIGYFISLLKNSLTHSTNHPNFLMIDTIAKYLGKTKPQYLSETDSTEDAKEGIKADDPTKYIQIYKYLLNLCVNRTDVQIIIVDNDVPSTIQESLTGRIAAQFSVNGLNNLPRGFIDDVYEIR